MIEARWITPLDEMLQILLPHDRKKLILGNSVSLDKYDHKDWHLKLFFENAVKDLKQDTTRSAKKISEDQVCICEHRDIDGKFWENLKLKYFPSDVQKLTISIGSMLYNDEVILIQDPFYHSGVNRRRSESRKDWSLYEHVDVDAFFPAEYFNSDDDEKSESM